MHYRKLGASSLNVSVLSFGAWQLGDVKYWGEYDVSEAHGAVHAALDAGVNLFDTAEMYGDGRSEEELAKALGSQRKNVYIASKVWPANAKPEDLRRSCEKSLKRLRTDVIDLYQVHWPICDASVADAAATLLNLKKEGKIRYIGVSNFGVNDLREWLEAGETASNQMAYSLLFRAIEFDITPFCMKNDIGVMAYMPVMQGLLTGRYTRVEDIDLNRRRTRHFGPARPGVMHDEPGAEEETFKVIERVRGIAQRVGVPMATLALAWTIAQPGITTAIIGARKAEQLRANLAAATVTLAPDVLDELDGVSETLKERLGNNADLWFSGEKQRVR